MLTEGWDCNTVTHIIGLRPFMSQLLCEQVVGRGLRRASYELAEDGLFCEEVAKVFGVPFEVIPFKANSSQPTPKEKRNRIFSRPDRAMLEIKFPRVERYSQAIRNKITVDWDSLPMLDILPTKIPPLVEMTGIAYNTEGRISLSGPGQIEDVDLKNWRQQTRMQEIEYHISRDITRFFLDEGKGSIPTQVLFPQIHQIVKKYIHSKVNAEAPADKKDIFLSPYYGWLIEILLQFIKPDTSEGEPPEIAVYEKNRHDGSTSQVDFWTSKQIYEVNKSHLNAIVADTKRWEQAAAFYIDTHPSVESFVKNASLGFAIPYIYNGQAHDYEPEFIIKLKGSASSIFLILETKGFDERKEIKMAAANRWVKAVNSEGSYGHWEYRCTNKITEINNIIDDVIKYINHA